VFAGRITYILLASMTSIHIRFLALGNTELLPQNVVVALIPSEERTLSISSCKEK
jgi:hypothetical protein